MGADSIHKKTSIYGAKIRGIFSGVVLGRGVGGFVLESPHHSALKMNLVAPNRGGGGGDLKGLSKNLSYSQFKAHSQKLKIRRIMEFAGSKSWDHGI